MIEQIEDLNVDRKEPLVAGMLQVPADDFEKKPYSLCREIQSLKFELPALTVTGTTRWG